MSLLCLSDFQISTRWISSSISFCLARLQKSVPTGSCSASDSNNPATDSMFWFFSFWFLSSYRVSFWHIKIFGETYDVLSLPKQLQNTNGCSECSLSGSETLKVEDLRSIFCSCLKTSKADPCSGFLWFLSLYEVSLQYFSKSRLYLLIFSLVEWFKMRTKSSYVLFLAPGL